MTERAAGIRRALGLVLGLVALLTAACGDGPTDSGERGEARVTHIVDGDTFDVVFTDGRDERIRPPQIDTPEVGECGYAEAAFALADLILGETVDLVPTSAGPDRDSHGRLLRAVELDGDDIGELLVRSGLARWVSRYAHEDGRLAAMYEAAEAAARSASAGLWLTCAWS